MLFLFCTILFVYTIVGDSRLCLHLIFSITDRIGSSIAMFLCQPYVGGTVVAVAVGCVFLPLFVRSFDAPYFSLPTTRMMDMSNFSFRAVNSARTFATLSPRRTMSPAIFFVVSWLFDDIWFPLMDVTFRFAAHFWLLPILGPVLDLRLFLVHFLCTAAFFCALS